MDCPTVITEKVQTKAERQMVSGTFSSPITCQIPFQCRQTSVKCYTRYRAESTLTTLGNSGTCLMAGGEGRFEVVQRGQTDTEKC